MELDNLNKDRIKICSKFVDAVEKHTNKYGLRIMNELLFLTSFMTKSTIEAMTECEEND